MKRPLEPTAGAKRAITWQTDHYGETFNTLDVSTRLHRYAGTVLLSCMPKRSAIDKRYYAEINRYAGTGGAMDFNIAIGTGDNPIEAALDGYRQARPDDVWWLVFDLELQAELLRREIVAVRAREALEAKLSLTLDDLEATMRTFVWDQP